MITRVTTSWGRHAASFPPKAAFTAATAAGKGRDSTKSEAREHKKEALALVGCGKMGMAMGRNLMRAGYPLFVHDKHNAEATAKLVAEGATAVTDARELGTQARTIVTMLPNDEVLHTVSQEFLPSLLPGALHIGCSTVSPFTSRTLALTHTARGVSFVGAPVFARPDGFEKRQAYFVVGGTDSRAIEEAQPILLSTGSQVFEFGNEDAGAGSVVKLCGNFLIASAIESIGEALALAENQGLDRVKVMKMFSATIFDCLIYEGYGDRVSRRDHRPGGFALEQGHKDVSLILDTARRSKVPMPFASLLQDRFTSALNQPCLGGLDWSAIGIDISKNAGENLVVEAAGLKTQTNNQARDKNKLAKNKSQTKNY